jgi:hypothetical protein
MKSKLFSYLATGHRAIYIPSKIKTGLIFSNFYFFLKCRASFRVPDCPSARNKLLHSSYPCGPWPQEICWYRDSNLKLGGSRPPSPELNAARTTLWVPNPLLVRSLFSCLCHLYLFSNHLAIQNSIESP